MEPIGEGNTTGAFFGTYDGNGKVITGLTINRPTTTYQSLFAFLNDAHIMDLGLEDVNMTGGNYTASLTGYARYGTIIDNCYATGVITGSSTYTAGLVAYLRDSGTTISNSYSAVNVIATRSNAYNYVAGLAGYANNSTVINSYNIGSVETPVESIYGGAVIGRDNRAVIENVYWNIDTSGLEVGVGSGDDIPGSTMSAMLQQATYVGFDFTEIWSIEEGSFPFLSWQGQAAAHNFPPPLPPTDLAATFENGVVTITWIPPDPQLGIPDSYNVYRDEEQINIDPVTTTEYSDENVEYWLSYEYTVTAVYGEVESAPSNPLVFATTDFAGGTGVEGDPFQIATADHLYGVRYVLDAHFEQVADIDLSAYSEGDGWEWIGETGMPFTGVYDGGYYVIRNLYIGTRATRTGLFGHITGATVKNIGLEDVNVIADRWSGALIGEAQNSVIQSCYVTGLIHATGQGVGAIAGRGNNSMFYDCYSTAVITGERLQHGGTIDVSGLIGELWNGDVVRSYFMGRFDYLYELEPLRAGAIAGWQRNAIPPQSVYWNTELSNFEFGAGFGTDIPGYTTAELSQQETYTGFDWDEVWSMDEGSTFPYLQWQGENNTHNRLPIAAPENISAQGGNQEVTLSWETSAEWTTNPIGYNVYRNGELIAATIDALNYTDTGLDNYSIYWYYVTARFADSESFFPQLAVVRTHGFAGSGTELDPYQISTPEQLAGMGAFYLLPDLYFEQVNDLDMDVYPHNVVWDAIGQHLMDFMANYDGNGYIINNLRPSTPSTSGGGLFGYYKHGSLKNIHLRNVSFLHEFGGSIGGLVSYAGENATIENCSVTGEVRGRLNIGLFASQADGATIRNCYAIGTVYGTGGNSPHIGGFVGNAYNNSTFENNYAKVNVIDGTRNVAGFIGRVVDGTISNNYNVGTVEPHDDADLNTVSGFIGVVEFGEPVFVNNYSNTEISGFEALIGAEGRTTADMTYPDYAENTYVDWDFAAIWADDTEGDINDSYPILFYQTDAPPALDTPVVTINIALNEEEEYEAYLEWNEIAGAAQYKVYSSEDPYTEDWGDPVITMETNYSEVVLESNKFYYVTASPE